MDDLCAVQRKMLEARFSRVCTQENRAWPWQIGGNGLHFQLAVRQWSELAPLRPGDCSHNGIPRVCWLCPGCHTNVGQFIRGFLGETFTEQVENGRRGDNIYRVGLQDIGIFVCERSKWQQMESAVRNDDEIGLLGGTHG